MYFFACPSRGRTSFVVQARRARNRFCSFIFFGVSKILPSQFFLIEPSKNLGKYVNLKEFFYFFKTQTRSYTTSAGEREYEVDRTITVRCRVPSSNRFDAHVVRNTNGDVPIVASWSRAKRVRRKFIFKAFSVFKYFMKTHYNYFFSAIYTFCIIFIYYVYYY